jgi:aerobic carbon-monoxide dehydrogenase large subunit
MTQTRTISLTVNGQPRHANVDTRTTLVDVLRDQLRLTGTHVGCEHGVCGACTVLMDGEAVRGCLMLAVQADGCRVETVESLAPDPSRLNALQAEFVRHHGVQCGFCTGGILMSLTAALRDNPGLTEDEIRDTLAGHLCRCTGYQGMVDAVLALVAGRRLDDASAGAHPSGGPASAARAEQAPAMRTPEGGYIGAPVPRREDARLLTGRGTFVDDLEMPGVVHAAMLRSSHAHARVRRIDTTAALALPGVLAVVTADDVADIQKPWPARMPSPVPGTSLRHGIRHTLPRDKVRYAGEVIAAVVADSRALAEDACDAIHVEYDVLPVVASAAAALAPGAPLVYEELGDNIAAHIVQRVGQPERAFASADHTLRETFRVMRGGSHSMEGRGVVARYDEALDAFTVWDATQAPHAIRTMLAYLFDLPEHRVRVIAPPDVGGGLGPKGSFYPEEALVCWLARHLRRPVKWIEDRREHFISAAQEREQVHEIEIAFTSDGRLVALRDVFTHDIGIYGALVAPVITACTVPGPYRIPNIHSEVRAVYTNLQPSGAVRGAGRPQGVFVMERMMDRMAETLGLDPAEVRARNLIPADAFPYPVGMVFRDGAPLTYDSGNYPELLRRALELADYPAARREQVALRARGRHRGIGVAICVEGVGLGPFEGAILRLDNRGRVVVTSGAPPQGQGYQTAFAQIAADAVGVRFEDVDVVTGDTGAIPFGIGSFASRVTANAGPAILQAGGALREKILALAAHLLEAAPPDLEIVDGAARVRGVPDRRAPLAEIARLGNAGVGFGMVMPPGLQIGLEASSYFTPSQATYSASAHVCILDVDADTGEVTIVRYIVGHDCGNVINPLIVEGQILGGVAHGLSNALYEEAIYDDQGQSLVQSFLDYPIPTAREMPRVEMFHLTTPSPINPLGVKGAGEAGTIPVTAAVGGAVEDALREFGVRVNRMPLNPASIVEMVRGR